jgi:intracellular multiplication protein IcmL
MTISSSNTETERNLNQELEALHNKRHPDNKLFIQDDLPYPSHVILQRNQFLRWIAKISFFLALGLGFAVVVLAVAIYIVSNRPPITLSYALDQDNRIVELQPISEPSVTDSDVIYFAGRRMQQFHLITFTNYIDHVLSLEQHFVNKRAFDNFQTNLISSRTIERIRTNQLASWAEPLQAPQITSFDPSSNTWVVTFPIRWYLGGGDFATSGTTFELTMHIQRVSRSQNLSGLGIAKYLLVQKKV